MAVHEQLDGGGIKGDEALKLFEDDVDGLPLFHRRDQPRHGVAQGFGLNHAPLAVFQQADVIYRYGQLAADGAEQGQVVVTVQVGAGEAVHTEDADDLIGADKGHAQPGAGGLAGGENLVGLEESLKIFMGVEHQGGAGAQDVADQAGAQFIALRGDALAFADIQNVFPFLFFGVVKGHEEVFRVYQAAHLGIETFQQLRKPSQRGQGMADMGNDGIEQGPGFVDLFAGGEAGLQLAVGFFQAVFGFLQLFEGLAAFGDVARHPENLLFAKGGDGGGEPARAGVDFQEVFCVDRLAGVQGPMDVIVHFQGQIGGQDFMNGLAQQVIGGAHEQGGLGGGDLNVTAFAVQHQHHIGHGGKEGAQFFFAGVAFGDVVQKQQGSGGGLPSLGGAAQRDFQIALVDRYLSLRFIILGGTGRLAESQQGGLLCQGLRQGHAQSVALIDFEQFRGAAVDIQNFILPIQQQNAVAQVFQQGVAGGGHKAEKIHAAEGPGGDQGGEEETEGDEIQLRAGDDTQEV